MDKFRPATIPDSEVDRTVRETVADFTRRPSFYAQSELHSADEVERFIRTHAQRGKMWKNDTYTVCIYDDLKPYPGWPKLVHLSIKRNDREPLHDWRDLQAIKNELVGPECEGVELYPAESRRVDTANQYHMFVIEEPGLKWPFGFTERLVDDAIGTTRAKQRPL